jgi:hypothetical protein
VQDISLPSRIGDVMVHVWVPCQTEGYPKPFIQWILNTSVTLNATSPKFESLGCVIHFGKTHILSYKVYENDSLLIVNPVCEKQIEYTNLTCVATSILGRDTKSHEFSVGKCKQMRL